MYSSSTDMFSFHTNINHPFNFTSSEYKDNIYDKRFSLTLSLDLSINQKSLPRSGTLQTSITKMK